MPSPNQQICLQLEVQEYEGAPWITFGPCYDADVLGIRLTDLDIDVVQFQAKILGRSGLYSEPSRVMEEGEYANVYIFHALAFIFL